MILTAKYCPTRSRIEDRWFELVSTLFRLSSRLNDLTGQHQLFHAMKLECVQVHQELAELHMSLRNHRTEHGC
jgi:hypothetical protein